MKKQVSESGGAFSLDNIHAVGGMVRRFKELKLDEDSDNESEEAVHEAEVITGNSLPH